MYSKKGLLPHLFSFEKQKFTSPQDSPYAPSTKKYF